MQYEDNPPQIDESERIRKWREERLRVAEQEKAERVAEAKQLRDEKQAREQVETDALVASTLPTASEIEAIENRLRRGARQRKRRLWTELLLIVFFPTLLWIGYLMFVATPVYESLSKFAVVKPSTGADASIGTLAGAFTPPTEIRDAFIANAYLRSPQLIERLEEKAGFLTKLSGPAVDPLIRLRNVEAIQWTKQDQFKRFFSSSVDIQTGLVTLVVRAPTADLATQVAHDALESTENHINQLAAGIYDIRVLQSSQSIEEARRQLEAAQTVLVNVQLTNETVDPSNQISTILTIINDQQVELFNLSNQLKSARLAVSPNKQRIQFLEQATADIEVAIAEQRARLLEGNETTGQAPLNTILLNHELAKLDLKFAEEALSTAIVSANSVASRALLDLPRFLAVVPPSVPVLASYPSRVLSTLIVIITMFVAFLALRFFRTARI